MAKSKQRSINVRAQIEILFKESYSQRKISKKLKISWCAVQYSLQRQLETGTNVDKKTWNAKGDK